MTETEYEPCSCCGGKVVDDKPSYIPLSEEEGEVLKITDQKCTQCGCVIVGKHQKLETIKDKKFYNKVEEYLETLVLKGRKHE